MVIANVGCTGNWRRLKMKGRSVSEGDIIMRGIKTLVPGRFPVIISASMTCFWKVQQTSNIDFVFPLGNFTKSPTTKPKLGDQSHR